MQVITIGSDIAKNVFQVHGAGNAVLRRKVRRDQLIPLLRDMQPCLIGMEACATAHHWARELIALGHVVKLMPPAYVKAYVKRNKNDAADAEAICEAVTRPTMRFVAVKSADAQSFLMLHRARHLLVQQRTAQISAMREHLAEYGVVAPRGGPMSWSNRSSRQGRWAAPRDGATGSYPLARTIEGLGAQIRKIEIELLAWYRTNQVCRRLLTIPGIGFITATALAATVVDAKVFRSGRQFAAWLGLVPKQHSSGGKDRMGGISKMGDRYLRHLLVVGATAVIRYTRRKATTVSTWANQLLERKPARLVTVAVANKVVRIAWAVMAREENYPATPSMAQG
ncbi:MAG: IS110 family transposase [Mesorhizobium sp.]|uniref:IS110 family transposase n=1 Tax=Mesorhizobium sp. TaxID=1871066 RepID=UPI000FE6E6F1|nr:IS110 family transposase [Mesorhizobium sp.]RWA95067.1 MAG: IS110 family transposase [Mesorhizobium sp.]RWK56787.1 MAG: IS110 family transposase [Mesorhizobium sp.]RWM40549.1 MAG: IS110 family transposase [Mesorhizobium sp.]RWM44398.1 MAG: IS110 family transposase [Mesorhizobium sp.]RWO21716.1 MAG: IS110 family transposase [Mesorhizobium sp.]